MIYKYILIIPPGASIKEQYLNQGYTLSDFCSLMNMSKEDVINLLNGDIPLTKSIANKLEIILGPPAKFWNNLESNYQKKIRKAKEMGKEIIKPCL